MNRQTLEFIKLLEDEYERLDSERELIIRKKKHLRQLIKIYKQP